MVSPFDDLDRVQLAGLVREYLMCGHLIDRAGMPHIIGRFGRDTMGGIAIDEWQGASPIYTRRMQRFLGFEGDTVEVIFKGMQFDIGAPPEFLDFRYTVIDDHHGEFHLDHCGALADVEPMGPEYVHTMCHTIEDPTFDATAVATNRRAQVRPVHRPPRVPADRAPVCAWTVVIDDSHDAVPDPEPMTALAATALASLPLPDSDPSEQGWSDYSGPLVADVAFGEFSRSVLIGLLHEISVQWHLLSMSCLRAVASSSPPESAGDVSTDIGWRQFDGICGLTSQRLVSLFDLDDSAEAIGSVLRWHPALGPCSYTGVKVEARPTLDDGNGADVIARIAVDDHPALGVDEPLNWIQILVAEVPDGERSALDSLVECVCPTARVQRIDPRHGEVAAWSVTLGHEPRAVSDNVTLARFSTGAEFQMSRPISVSIR